MKSFLLCVFGIACIVFVVYIEGERLCRLTSLENQVCELSRSLTATEFFLQEKFGTEWVNYKGHMKAVYNYNDPITE